MSTSQNTIAIALRRWIKALSPSYMQDEVVFPAFGIDLAPNFGPVVLSWRSRLRQNELAYDESPARHPRMDRPENLGIKKLGAKIEFLTKACRKCSRNSVTDCLRRNTRPTAFRSSTTSFLPTSKSCSMAGRLQLRMRAIFGCEFD